jgi:hypothetical protein
MIHKIPVPGVAATLAAVIAFGAALSPAIAQSDPAKEGAAKAPPTLDFEYYRTRVEPIFITQRSPNHARCYGCHEKSKHKEFGLNLEPLSPGATSYTEEQSRKNFKLVSHLVAPGDLSSSLLLMHPLAPERGGDAVRIHSGGRQFESQDDPDWKIIAAWVKGEKASAH